MNDDILAGKWKQVRGHLQEWWGELTNDDIDEIEGRRDVLVGKLQERYGWSKRRAEKEIETQLGSFSTMNRR